MRNSKGDGNTGMDKWTQPWTEDLYHVITAGIVQQWDIRAMYAFITSISFFDFSTGEKSKNLVACWESYSCHLSQLFFFLSLKPLELLKSSRENQRYSIANEMYIFHPVSSDSPQGLLPTGHCNSRQEEYFNSSTLLILSAVAKIHVARYNRISSWQLQHIFLVARLLFYNLYPIYLDSSKLMHLQEERREDRLK